MVGGKMVYRKGMSKDIGKKQGHWKAIEVSDSTPLINSNRMENTVSVNQNTLVPISRHYGDDLYIDNEEACLSEQSSRPWRDLDESRAIAGDTYVVDKIKKSYLFSKTP